MTDKYAYSQWIAIGSRWIWQSSGLAADLAIPRELL
jgi:hypothetical protein